MEVVYEYKKTICQQFKIDTVCHLLSSGKKITEVAQDSGYVMN